MEFPFPLPKPLPHEEQLKLVIRAQAGDVQASQKLISTNIRLICYWASKYERQYKGDPLDLFSVASLAFYPAIRNFNPARSSKFTILAIAYMRRDLSKFVIANISQVKFATDTKTIGAVNRIAKMIARDPNVKVEEVAAKLKITVEQAKRVIGALRLADVSLDKKIHSQRQHTNNDDFSSAILKDSIVDARPSVEDELSEIEQDQDLSILLHEAIETLPDLQQKVVRLYLLAEPKRTLVEVAKMLGVSREWVRKQSELAKQSIKEYIGGVE